MHLCNSILLCCTFLVHIVGSEGTVPPISEIEKAQFEKVAKADYELEKGVSFSGPRLHEILDHEDQFSPEIIAAVIVAHECKNLEVKSTRHCWDKDFVDRIVRCMNFSINTTRII